MLRPDLPIKKHPHYAGQLSKIIFLVIIVSFGIWIAAKIAYNYEYKTLHDLLVIALFSSFFVILFFGNRLHKRAECPQCNKKLASSDNKRIKLSGNLENGNSYMTCTNCKVIWDLGIGSPD